MKNSVSATLAIAAAFGAAISPAVLAQDRAPDLRDDFAVERGGMVSQLDLSQRIEANSNPSLQPDGNGPVYLSNTRLTYRLTTETREQRLILNASGALRLSESPDTDGIQTGAVDPRIAAAYSRFSAASRLDVMASVQRTQLDTVDPLTNFTNATGSQILVEDFDQLTGGGTRDALTFSAELSIRDDAPFGMSFRADVSDLSYADTTNPNLIDSTRSTVRATGRFDITPVMTASLGLYYTQLETDVTTRARTGLDGDLVIDRPDGSYGGNIRVTNGDAGTQAGFGLAREINLPNSSYTGALGLTRATTEETFVTGYFLALHDLPNGELTAKAERRLDVDNDDTEEMITSLSLGATYNISDLGQLNLSVDYADSTTLRTDTSTALSSIGVTYTHALTPDWAVDAGAKYQQRSVTGLDDADSTSVSLTVRRTFDLRH